MKYFTISTIKQKCGYLAISAAIFTFGLIGCSKDTQTDTNLTGKGNILVNSNQTELNSRVTLANKIMLVEPVITNSTKSSKETQQIDLTQNYVFTLKAEVAPLVYEGNTLQASHVKIYDQYAFVTYNTKGDKYLGGVDIIDVSNIEAPKIIRHLIFPHADVSSVDYYDKKLYIVGAIDLDKDSLYKHLEHPSMLEVISLTSGYDVAKVDTVIDLGSYVGTDVRVTSDLIYATSGSNGYLKGFNHAYKNIFSKSITDARAIEANSSNTYVLQAQPAQINKYSLTDASDQGSYAVWDESLQSEAKSELAASDKYIFAALNYGGMKMLNLDGTLKQWVAKPNTPEGSLDENYVTNSVSLNNDLVLFANGEAGLYLGDIIASKNDSLAIFGRIRFTDGSVNFVEAHDNIIFVATGTGGLKILSIGIDEGIPDDIITTKPCSTLYDHVIQLFPKSENNYATYANTLFAPNTPRSIKLSKESEVYITFIHSSANWRNSLGYYTYLESNPPTTTDILNKHILYPNVSMVNDGGGLVTGDMLKIGTGKFPAGTVIGFYLVADGWNNGLVTDGYYSSYTDNRFNIGGLIQHSLFIDKACDDLVLLFEDTSISSLYGSDRDFNDVIFSVSDNSNPDKASVSFDLTDIPKL